MKNLTAKVFFLAFGLATPGLPAATCVPCARDANGRIRRSPIGRRAFRQGHPCPSTGRISGACPGYVIDHVKALKHGGADETGNMQWQTIAAAKTKDRVE